ncbi:MAG: serine hydrolase domain-containing protein [Gemmatimonadaceae bacterium]
MTTTSALRAPLRALLRELFLPLLAGAALSSRVGAQQAADAGRDFDAIDAHVERLMRAERIPGVSIAIVHHDTIVHVRGFGDDGRGRAVTANTGFVLGSMSKSFTALAIMQLEERGLIALDAPVQRYLPWFRVGDAGASAAITIRQLLNHTSGIPTGAPRAHGDHLTITDHVRALAGVSLSHTPGATHEYSSPNYQVLGAVVEAVSGQPFGMYVDQAILAPLDMRHSHTDAVRAGVGDMGRGHVYVLGFPMHASISAEPDRLPAAAMVSSAGDLAHFLIAQLQLGEYAGTRVLGADAMTRMHAGGAPSDGFSYAFGWRDGRLAGARAVHHGGITSHFRGKMVMLPEQGWGVAVLTNASSALPWPLVPASHRLADDIAAHLVGQPLPPVSSRHRMFFAVVAIAMLAVLASQARALLRAWRATSGVAGRRLAWASATDLALVAGVAVLPRFVGLTWPELLRGAPDVAWWLLVTSALGLLTMAARVMRHGSAPLAGPLDNRRVRE